MYRRTGRGRVMLLVFLALSILVITLDYRQGEGGPLERAREISVAIVAPIQRGFAAIFRPVGDFFSSISDLNNLRDENDELTTQLEDAQAEIEHAEDLALDNQRLTELLDLQESYSAMDSVAAEVIAKVPSNYKWAYVINKGSEDGIEKNMAVINTDGLVGKIVQVDTHRATVLLLIDPEAAAGARIEGDRDLGLVTGNGVGEDLSLEFINPNTEVTLFDRIETSGYDGGVFPPGIPIGTVSSVGGEGPSVEQDLDVQPAVDFTALDFLLVLLETGPDAGEGD